MIPVQPVILCAGSGTRLWPLSRAGFPKQFLCLTGEESLFQLAAKRLMVLGASDINVANPYIVSGEDHRFLATEQLREIGIELGAALLEPIGRNTAPALILAALAAQQSGADPVLVVTPADQTVADQAAFTAAMQTAIREAATGSIVILGITPDRPETGYGYIQVEPEAEKSALAVRRFVEKPNAATAQNYLKAATIGTPACSCLKPPSGFKHSSSFGPTSWSLPELLGKNARPMQMQRRASSGQVKPRSSKSLPNRLTMP